MGLEALGKTHEYALKLKRAMWKGPHQDANINSLLESQRILLKLDSPERAGEASAARLQLRRAEVTRLWNESKQCYGMLLQGVFC